MIMTGFLEVVVPAGGRLLTNVLSGVDGVTRRIKRLIITPNAAASNYTVLAYLDQKQHVEIDTFLIPAEAPYVDMDVELPTGVALSIGYEDIGGGGATISLGFEWEE